MVAVLAALWPEGADASSPGTLEPAAASRPLLVPPSGRVVHGMGQWEQYNVRLLARLPDAVRPAAQLLFVNIGDTPRGWRPQGVSARLESLARDGFIPVLDIGLRGNQPSPTELKQLADPLFGVDHDVAATTRYDGRLRDLATTIRDFGRPMLVRIGGEFNGWWNGYHPYAYPKAFRKIVDLFRTAGVRNVAFCWCYEPAAPGDFADTNALSEAKWYPGGEVVDWFGIDWFNAEDFSGPLTGRNGLSAHGRTRKFLDMAVAAGKPVIIAESAPCRYDLADAAQADAAWREWFGPYFRMIDERPEIQWFHLISYDWTRAGYSAQSGWKNNDLTADPRLLGRLLEQLGKPRYLHASEKEKLTGYPETTRGGARSADPSTSPPSPVTVPAGSGRAGDTRERQAALAKWDDASRHRPQTGPGGTAWDSQYRSFIQTDESAVSKGLPTHAEAAQAILADAARSPQNRLQHLGWVLFIKHFSQAYRPASATADLKQLYEALVDLQAANTLGNTSFPFEGDGRLTIHRDVVYGHSHPEMQKLDAYLVKSAQRTPVVIEIHGGGWRRGAKSQFVYPGDLIGAILRAGVSVISIDYRLSPQHTMPAPMQDVVRAVQFVRSKAGEWHLDPDRIAALGGSAGAHLAAWVALHGDLAKPDSPDAVERFSSRLTCFVVLSGPMDLTRVRPTELARQPLRGQDFAHAFTAAFGCTAEQFEQDPEIRQRLREASPLFLVTADDPPAFVMGAWGEDLAVLRDPPVPAVINDPHSVWHGVLLAEAMRKVNVPVVVRLGPEVGRDPTADTTAIVSFLRKRIGSHIPPLGPLPVEE